MTKPIAAAAVIVVLSAPQLGAKSQAETESAVPEERSWVEVLLPTLSLLATR